MKQVDLHRFSERVSTELHSHLLPFWCGPALDHENGGWLAWISNDLRPDYSKPKGLILNTRLLWSFSAVYRVSPDERSREMAFRAFEIVMNHFWDKQWGGAFWQLDRKGNVLDSSKKTYGQAFYIYALAEFYQAFGKFEALQRATELFDLIEQNASDPGHGGYFEVRRRDWSTATDLRLSDKDANEAKSMNNHLHVLEAYTTLSRAWETANGNLSEALLSNRNQRLELIAARLRELLSIFCRHIVHPVTNHFHHFFSEDWQVRSDTYTFGHDIEGSWLLCEAAETLCDNKLLSSYQELAVRMATTVLKEGLDLDGGLHYEGRAGAVIDRGKEWWPQAEAVVGFLNAFQISGDREFIGAAEAVWKYIEDHIVDRTHGEWFWRIDPEGHPDPALPKVSEWKDPYHAVRACLETLKRLRQVSSCNYSL